MQNAVSKQYFPDIKKFTLIFLGSFSWLLTVAKSGWYYDALGLNGSGFGFWGANGHDGIWHIALTESLAKGSLNMTVFAGEKIPNYPIGFDLLLALINKITSIPVVNLYFQIIPVVLSVGI